MSTITLLRRAAAAIPFNITDSANGLANKRVTWSLALAASGPRVMRKVGALPGSSADITITSQTAGAISGTINSAAADFATLTAAQYAATLWVDDGAGADTCVTAGGVDTVTIVDDVARIA